MIRAKLLLSLGLVAGLISGCTRDIPNEYGNQRPPVDTIDERDRGLQSKDVVSASDLMARDLLADEGLRRANAQWVMVVDRFEDHTVDRRFNVNYDVFIERLRTNIGQYGKGNVTLVENKAKLSSGCQMVMCDASVHTISYTIDAATHWKLCNRKDRIYVDSP